MYWCTCVGVNIGCVIVLTGNSCVVGLAQCSQLRCNSDEKSLADIDRELGSDGLDGVVYLLLMTH